MKKICRFLTESLCILLALFFTVSLKAEAEEMTSGTLGDYGNIGWIYDERTKTLTLTGEYDGALGSSSGGSYFNEICPDVEKIVVKDCKLYNCSFMFSGLKKLQSVTFENFDTSQVTDMEEMFCGCSGLITLDVSSFDTSQVINMNEMFSVCSGLTKLNVSSFDTSKVTDMYGMFWGCTELESLDVSGFDTSKVTNMDSMFRECTGLESLDASGFDTSKVTDMSAMFYGCTGLESLDVSGFDTSKVTNMSHMFRECKGLGSLDVSGFDTSKVKDMSCMFADCASLESLDVSSFDTSNVGRTGYYEPAVLDMNSMFSECTSLKSIDVSGFDTSNVNNFSYMFYGCTSLTDIDISGFFDAADDSIDFRTAEGMFKDCTSLRSIDLNGVELSDVRYMFSGCSNLTILNLRDVEVTYYRPIDLLVGCDALKIFYTPKNVDEILLPGTFVDEQGNETNSVTTAFCNKKLRKESVFQVEAFVERMYTVALGRTSDPSGIDYWTAQLLTHQVDGADIAEGFILSDEFVEKNYDNTDYLKVMYKTFFNREADAAGMAYWLEQMSVGKSRRSVLAGFVNSNEFTEICSSYGIERGTMEDEPVETGVEQFVERLYTIALERPSEPAGLAEWARRINAGESTPEYVAKFFFLSEEYQQKNTSNEKYVESLYLVFMDRTSEVNGKAYWVEQLNQGMNREAVLEGFAQSAEFKEIMARYGL